jgi:hypothetical protein
MDAGKNGYCGYVRSSGQVSGPAVIADKEEGIPPQFDGFAEPQLPAEVDYPSARSLLKNPPGVAF